MKIRELLEAVYANTAHTRLDKIKEVFAALKRDFPAYVAAKGYETAIKLAKTKIEQFHELDWLINPILAGDVKANAAFAKFYKEVDEFVAQIESRMY